MVLLKIIYIYYLIVSKITIYYVQLFFYTQNKLYEQ